MTSTQLPGVERRLKKNAAQAAYRARRKAEIEASRAEVAKVKAERKAPKATTAAKASKPKPKKAAIAKAGESRTDLCLRLLMRAKGATVAEIMEPTGWLPHTTRAFISATLGKKLGHKIESEKVEGRGRVYRIAEAESEVA
jgi:hypothetical protein